MSAAVTDCAPEFSRSRGQRLDALDRANEIRTKRSALKRDVKARRVSATSILSDPPAYVDTMKVWDLLLAMPKVGRVKANQALVRLRIAPSKTISGLSQRQRDELIAYLSMPPVTKREYQDAYLRDYRAMKSTIVHAARWTMQPCDTRTKCNHVIDSRRVSDDEAKVTCLTCLRVLRSEDRAKRQARWAAKA